MTALERLSTCVEKLVVAKGLVSNSTARAIIARRDIPEFSETPIRDRTLWRQRESVLSEL